MSGGCPGTPTPGNTRDGAPESFPSPPFVRSAAETCCLALWLLPWSLVAAPLVVCSRSFFVRWGFLGPRQHTETGSRRTPATAATGFCNPLLKKEKHRKSLRKPVAAVAGLCVLALGAHAAAAAKPTALTAATTLRIAQLRTRGFPCYRRLTWAAPATACDITVVTPAPLGRYNTV